MNEVYEFLKELGIYYLATTDGNQPRVRPFGTVNIFDGKLYIQTGKKKRVSKELASNPKAEICACKDGTWLRVSGELVNDDRIEAKADLLEKYPMLQKMYDAEDDNTQVLYFKDATATFMSMDGEFKEIHF